MEEHLLQSQKNEVLALVRAQGFAPHEFRWQLAPSISEDRGSVPCLVHQGSPYYFKFEYDLPVRYSEFAPGEAEPTQRARHESWSAQLGTVERWLSYLRRERETPDLWNLVEEQGDLLGAPDAVDNTPFAPAEREHIAEQFAEIKEYARQAHALSDDQFRALEGRLDYLVDAAGRLPRFDWRNALVGALLGLVTDAVLPAEVVRDVFGMIGRGLGTLFGLELPELPPSAG